MKPIFDTNLFNSMARTTGDLYILMFIEAKHVF